MQCAGSQADLAAQIGTSRSARAGGYSPARVHSTHRGAAHRSSKPRASLRWPAVRPWRSALL
jgi:hypothetical protein